MTSIAVDSSSRSLLAIILAAGEGTRMISARPKVLHEVGGRSLLAHVLASVAACHASAAAVIVGPGRDDVGREAARVYPGAHIRVQEQRRGTAHAALAARDLIAQGFDDIMVLFGDTPLITPETLARLRQALAGGVAVAALGFEAADPTGYGRLIVADGRLLAIREQKDASPAERAIGLCNGGVMGLAGRHALDLLTSVGDDNAQGEFYLTDVVALARARGLEAGVALVDGDEIAGVNDRVQLAEAEALLQQRLRRRAMIAGATLTAPETVFLSADTRLAPDVLVEPHVVFGPGVTVESGAVIHAFSHLEGAHIGPGASVGPFARLRPGTKLAAKARIGNFVEVKNADIAEGAKLNHLTYVGDATIGVGANLGAGTITCNYDGFAKHRTVIGAGAFIGSNSALVAPVVIGAGAYVGSGSVITRDVPDDALALGRGRQVTREGWAAALRADRAKPKG